VLSGDTFGELRLKVLAAFMKVSKTLNYSLADFMMYTEEGKPLNIDDRYKLRDIPMMKYLRF